MKKTKNSFYFDGDITNGKGFMRMFTFNAGVCKTLLNSEVKTSGKHHELEVLVSKSTSLKKSEDNMTKRMGRDVLSEMKDTPAFQHVNAVAKYGGYQTLPQSLVGNGSRISSSLTAQKLLDFLCEKVKIRKIEVGNSYQLSGIMVHEFDAESFCQLEKINQT